MRFIDHPSCHCIADDVRRSKRRQITEILERLRVPLAHYIGLRISVKHIDDLPRISVRCHRILRRAAVIRSQAADLVLVSLKLLEVRHPFVLVHNRLCGLHCPGCRLRFGSIRFILVSVHLISVGNREAQL